MKVAAVAPSPLPAGAGGPLKAVRPGEAARCGPGPGVSPVAAEQAAAALLYDMKGCYSRLRALVPTLPRHRKVSKVELLQHVIDYIWDLQLELQCGPPRPAAAADSPEPRHQSWHQGLADPEDTGVWYPSPFLGITPNSHFAPGRRFGLELLQSTLQKEHEMNLTGSYNTPLLGTLTYAVPRIHIHELQMNESTLDFAEGVGVRLMVQRARIQLSADWAAQLGAVQDSGSVELRMQDLAMAAVLGVSEDGSGRPTVWSAGCDTHGTDLHMEFHRGYSWLYNLLAPLLQRTLRQQLNKQLCLVLNRGVDRLDAVLKHMKVSTQLDNFAAIDHSLLGPPAFTEESGDIALKVTSSQVSLGQIWEWRSLADPHIRVSVQGEIFRVGTYQQRPSALPVALPVALPMALPVALPTPLPRTPPMAHEPTLLLAVTEFLANSAAFTYFTAGALRRNFSSNTLPRQFPLQLRTKSMEVFSPELQERYPDRPMELHLWARQQPLLSCQPDALHGSLFSSAEAFVVLPNATRVPAFLLNIDANVTGKPTITRNRLGGTVRLTGLRVTQVASNVGPVEGFVLIATDLQYEP
ncbi:hypothetical protein DUI87_27855 [Hirundo rustica rustica]|uniref:Bactericidal permeability-increasing protein n=1 Tax=Hirundo rustica rustica TaxID=333673 RepID=A0A3M0J4M9_HIRRU|nr:hypothetical protein DUI87_27855 [Hirundo rustica rustica]